MKKLLIHFIYSFVQQTFQAATMGLLLRRKKKKNLTGEKKDNK